MNGAIFHMLLLQMYVNVEAAKKKCMQKPVSICIIAPTYIHKCLLSELNFLVLFVYSFFLLFLFLVPSFLFYIFFSITDYSQT